MSRLHDLFEQRLTEACDALWDALVDPREAYLDDDGRWWRGLGGSLGQQAASAGAVLGEDELGVVRLECRHLAATNEFAVNGHENRISYLVGPGHSYRAAVRKGAAPALELVDDVQCVIDEFLEVNAWQSRQQEIVRRMDRDGEAFLRSSWARAA